MENAGIGPGKPDSKKSYQLPLLFVMGRLILLASLPFESVQGYGDFWNFFRQASLGIPFLDYWTEFPPLFPFISRGLYLLVGGKEAAYTYLVVVLLTLLQGINIYLTIKIGEIVQGGKRHRRTGSVYLILTLGLFYTWSYFDTIGVFFLLLGLYLLLVEKDHWAVLAISLGGLTKWFPLLILPAAWKVRDNKRALLITLAVVGIVGLVWGGLYVVQPEMVEASLLSQLNKGSWETVWALVDGNLGTGNFHPEADRLQPGTAALSTGNPARVPSWLTLALFGAFGLYLLWRSPVKGTKWLVDFLGLTVVIFFLWSPGYSPQWVLYLLPLALLSLDEFQGSLFAAALILLHLLEWPILLSRGQFWSLWFVIPARTVLLGLLGIRFFQLSRANRSLPERGGA